jgi:hypothetical protein
MSVIEDVFHPDRSGFANEPLNAPFKDMTVVGNWAVTRNCGLVLLNAYWSN